MKKILYSVMALAIATITFTACEDVPEPYPQPVVNDGSSEVIEGAEGTGSLTEPYNVAAILNKVKAMQSGEQSDDAYYIKGKVSRIAFDNSGAELNFDQGTYGNATFYISDDGTTTNEFYIYRALYLGNKKWTKTAGDILKVGDEVIVVGKVTNYNGTTPETVNGTSFVYQLNGVSNGGEIAEPGVAGEATGDGSLENPFNSVAANNAANALADNAKSTQDYYIKGKVVSIKENYTTQYGNAAFYISDDGTTAGQFYVYRALYLGNKKYTSGDVLKEGDEVVVYGKITKYVSTYGTTLETVQNEAFLYSLNGKSEGGNENGGQGEGQTTDPAGAGTQADPFNVAKALEYVKALPADQETAEEFYIKGKVSQITNNYVADNYGNATFYISDDGQTGTQFYCFRTLYLGNQKYTKGQLLKTGDDVVICGKLVNYRGNTPETAQNAAYLYSLNGSTEVTEGGDEPTPAPDPTGLGSYDSPYTVSAAIAKGTATATTGVYLKGYIVGYVEGQVLSSGAKFNSEATVQTNLLIAETPTETDVTKCMPVQLPAGNVRTGINLQTNPSFYGKEALLYGNIEKYFGATGFKSVTYAESDGKTIGTKP